MSDSPELYLSAVTKFVLSTYRRKHGVCRCQISRKTRYMFHNLKLSRLQIAVIPVIQSSNNNLLTTSSYQFVQYSEDNIDLFNVPVIMAEFGRTRLPEEIVIGNGKTYNGGYKNGPLNPGQNYLIFVRDVTTLRRGTKNEVCE